jgi:hypothetical protein
LGVEIPVTVWTGSGRLSLRISILDWLFGTLKGLGFLPIFGFASIFGLLEL